MSCFLINISNRIKFRHLFKEPHFPLSFVFLCRSQLCYTIYSKARTQRENTKEMKITALLVLKCPEGSDPIILANATDVSHFGYFQRSSVREFIIFVSRTVASRTPSGQRQSVQHEGPYLPTCSLLFHSGLVICNYLDRFVFPIFYFF